MSDQFLGEIRMFGCDYAPRDWAFCDGGLLPIRQNTPLFSLLGTVYGGDGTTTFGLPNLQGRVPIAVGQGPGLTERALGEADGAATVTLTAAQTPAHTHQMSANNANAADTNVPSPNATLAVSAGGTLYQAAANTMLASTALTPAGGDQAHDNLQPYLATNFCIALNGVFPPRP